jgi:acyl-CoA oxidase
VYEALWKQVQMEPMNKDEVTPAYDVCLPFDV